MLQHWLAIPVKVVFSSFNIAFTILLCLLLSSWTTQVKISKWKSQLEYNILCNQWVIPWVINRKLTSNNKHQINKYQTTQARSLIVKYQKKQEISLITPWCLHWKSEDALLLKDDDVLVSDNGAKKCFWLGENGY